MIYWLTTIKSQIAKKHSNKIRKNNICCNKENGKKISVSNHNENDKKIMEGIFFLKAFLADRYN